MVFLRSNNINNLRCLTLVMPYAFINFDLTNTDTLRFAKENLISVPFQRSKTTGRPFFQMSFLRFWGPIGCLVRSSL